MTRSQVHSVHFIQYIRDEDGERYLSVSYRVEMDFVPFIGMFIQFEKPFFEWEYQVEKVSWTRGWKSNFVCNMKTIQYSPSLLDHQWMNISSFNEVYEFYQEICRTNNETYSNGEVKMQVTDYDEKNQTWVSSLD